jgi:hypothetical protein
MFITKTAKKEGIQVAKIRAGHKTIQTTEGYIHFTINDYLKDKFNAIKIKGDPNMLGKQS